MQLSVSAGIAVEGEAAVAVLVQLDKRKRRPPVRVGNQAGRRDVVFFETFAQGSAKIILADFADKASRYPQSGQLYRNVCRSTARMRAEQSMIPLDLNRGKVN